MPPNQAGVIAWAVGAAHPRARAIAEQRGAVLCLARRSKPTRRLHSDRNQRPCWPG